MWVDVIFEGCKRPYVYLHYIFISYKCESLCLSPLFDDRDAHVFPITGIRGKLEAPEPSNDNSILLKGGTPLSSAHACLPSTV